MTPASSTQTARWYASSFKATAPGADTQHTCSPNTLQIDGPVFSLPAAM